MTSRRVLDVLVGIYVSIIVVTASALVRWETVAPTFSITRAVAVGLGAAVVVALIAGTVSDLVQRVTSRLAMAVTCGLPLVYLVYFLFVLEPGSTQGFVAGVGLFAVFPGIGINSVAQQITTRRLRTMSTKITSVTVGAYKRTALRRWLHIGKHVYVFGLVGLLIGGIVLIGLKNTQFQLLITLGTIGFTVFGFVEKKLLNVRGDDGSMIIVTDMGLTVDQCMNGWTNRRFVHWDEFEGYRLTDNTVELVFSKLFIRKWTFDREAISDEAALSDALADYLPRLDKTGERMDKKIESYCQK